MKKRIYTLLMLVFAVGIFLQPANAQIPVTVTNNTNTTPNLQASYTSLALALADLNLVTAMTGPVTLTLAAGNETAPPTGLTIGSASLNAVLSAINTVTIVGSGAWLYAGIGTATPSSAAPDGILKIVGADYITIDGLTVADNNSTNPETMEFGIGLFKASLSDGAQHNTIINCQIIMKSINNASGLSPMVDGSVGILVINSTPTAATTPLVPTTAAGANSYNRFYSNETIGGNYGIALSGYAASSPFSAGDTGNDIGGNSSGTRNYILDFGGASGATNPSAGIRANNQWGLNISYNTLNNQQFPFQLHPNTLRGIYAQAGTSASITIAHNDIGIYGSGTTQSVYGIDNGVGSTASSNTVDISYNQVVGEYSTATTGTFYGIQNTATAATVNVASNTVHYISTPGTGAIYGMTLGSPTTLNVTNNSVDNITKTGNGAIYGIQMGTATITCQNNTVDLLSCTAAASTASIYGIYDGASAVVENYSSNIIRRFSSTSTGSIYGLNINTATGNKTVQNNQIYSLSLSGGGTIFGFNMSYGSTDVISNNQIHNLSISGSASGTIYGLRISAGTLNNVYNNFITALSNEYGTAGAIYGLYIATGTTNNVYRNEVCNISSGSLNPAVYGAYLVSGTYNNLYNNLIGDLRTPTANAAIPLAGIYVGGGTNANVYYNTVYLNATSTGALFGSAALYASTSPNLDMRNNILVNTSTPKGAGLTSAYRRSGTSLTAYLSISNNNYYYAGIPSASMLIYHDGTNSDQTLATFQARVAPRESASLTSAGGPSFESTTCLELSYLHINQAVSSVIESGGAVIAGYDNDYDNDVRQGSAGYPAQVFGGGSAPDIGADEYDGIPDYTCTTTVPGNTLCTPNSICLGQSVTLSMQYAQSGTGITYQWQSSVNGTDWADIPSAVSATYTVTPSAALYYQCMVTCHNGIPVFYNSTPVQVTFANNITSTTQGSRCGEGTVQLLATANSGTVNWYSATSGGSPVGTGSPFTTPSIITTTTYYAGADVPASGTTLGAGASTSSGYESPFYHLYGGKKSQYLVLGSELTAAGLSAGNINSLAFEIASPGISYNSFNLSIGNTALTALTTTLQTGLTSVYTAASITPTAGIYKITFSAPFAWNGSSNIIIETCWSNNNTGGASATVKYDPTSFVSESYYRVDNVAPATLCAAATATNTMSARPRMFFNYVPVCLGPRTPVVATVTPAPAITVTALPSSTCAGQLVNLNVLSQNRDYTYFWQPGNLSGDGQAVYPEASTTYSVTATDAGSGCITSGSASVTVLNTPAPVTITPPAPTINAGSIQQLIATGGEVSGVVLFTENFNTPANTWTTVNSSTGGTNPANAAWTLEPDGYIYSSVAYHSNDNSQFYMSNSDAQGSGSTTNTEIISPVINATGFSAMTLTFWHYFRWTDASSQAWVEVSTDGGATWNPTPLAFYNTATIGAAAAFAQATIDMTSYAGQNNLKIRFRYSDTYGWYWCIDNVAITGSAQTNMAWSPLNAGLYLNPGATTAYGGENQDTIYAKPTRTTTYTASATNVSTQCVRSKQVTVTVLGGTITGPITDEQGVPPPTNEMYIQAHRPCNPSDTLSTLNGGITYYVLNGVGTYTVYYYQFANPPAPGEQVFITFHNMTTNEFDMEKVVITGPVTSYPVVIHLARHVILPTFTSCVTVAIPPHKTLKINYTYVSWCANTDVFFWNGIRWEKYSQWNFNLAGSWRYIRNDSDKPVIYCIHNDDHTGRTELELIIDEPIMSTSPSNASVYALMNMGCKNHPWPSCEFGNIVAQNYTFTDAPNAWLDQFPSRLGQDGVQNLTIQFESYDNMYWNNMSLMIDLINVTQSGTLELNIPDATIPYMSVMVSAGDTFSFFNPGGIIAPGIHTMTLVATGGLSMGIDCFNFSSLVVPPPLDVYVMVEEPLCYGQCTGVGVSSPYGGTPPYTFLWSNGATTQIITGLCPDMYDVMVTDANGYSVWRGGFLVSWPAEISLSAAVTSAACPGSNDGGIDLSVSGGNPGYSYLWSSSATTQDISNLAPGTYTVTVTDGNSCLKTGSWTVLQTNSVCPNVTITGNVNTTECYDSPYLLTVAGGTTTFIVSSPGNVTLIAGWKIKIEPGTKVNYGGKLHAYISTTYCSGTKMTEFAETGVADPEMVLSHTFFTLFPNPTTGNFTLVQKGDKVYGTVRVDVYSMTGEKVLTDRMVGEKQHEFRFAGLPEGLYFVKVVADGYVETLKLVKTR